MTDDLVSDLKFRASGGDGLARRSLARIEALEANVTSFSFQHTLDQEHIEALEAAGKRLADAVEVYTGNTSSRHDLGDALAAWRAVEGDRDE